MFGWFKRKKPQPKVIDLPKLLIAAVAYDYTWTLPTGRKEKETITFTLFETPAGERSFSVLHYGNCER